MMDGQPFGQMALLGTEVLERLMPMYLWVGATGHIRAAGPTLAKLADGQPLEGSFLFDRFVVEKPRAVDDMERLRGLFGQKLVMTMAGQPDTMLRGLALPLPEGQGALFNLSFGIAVADAVREHRLTNADFAPTDLTVELLYLTEVKAAVMGELGALNRRLQAARAASEAQALTDALTGLANRRALDAELAQATLLACRGAGDFALLHLDLDYFKRVNDSFGHAAGDAVLVEVASILREETRKSDTVARVGGDEFVIILRGEGSASHAARIGERIISELERPILYENSPCLISGSIGVTLSNFYAMPTVEQMQADADAATYGSKAAGRGCCTVWKPAV